MDIYCCACEKQHKVRLTDGAEIYPHRPDLRSLPFWKCDTSGNYVGCHHKTQNRTRPLGNIPTPEIREARQYIHSALDPLWQSGRYKRKDIYAKISERIGWKYHTAKIKDVGEARKVYGIIKELAA